MSNLLKSSKSVTEDIAERVGNESECQMSDISIAGKTNLRFQANLASICEEGMTVFEKYLETFRSNGEAIAKLGENFESLDSQYAERIR